MPTYEYRCPQGHDFEKFFKTISASVPELECPECGAMAARQLSGGAGLMFKGSGFYLTDYGKNAHRGGGATKSSSGSESKGDSKSDSAKPKAESAKSETAAPKSESKPATPKPKSE